MGKNTASVCTQIALKPRRRAHGVGWAPKEKWIFMGGLGLIKAGLAEADVKNEKGVGARPFLRTRRVLPRAGDVCTLSPTEL